MGRQHQGALPAGQMHQAGVLPEGQLLVAWRAGQRRRVAVLEGRQYQGAWRASQRRRGVVPEGQLLVAWQVAQQEALLCPGPAAGRSLEGSLAALQFQERRAGPLCRAAQLEVLWSLGALKAGPLLEAMQAAGRASRQ